VRLGERERDVEQELAARRIRDDGALVADDGIVKASRLEVRPNRAEHPAGDDDHVRAARPRAHERVARARPQHAVLRDQRPVEVEREGGDAPREIRGKLYGALPPVDVTTKAATSAICWVERLLLKAGITAPPFVTCAVAAW
jgi:hypothetical protein